MKQSSSSGTTTLTLASSRHFNDPFDPAPLLSLAGGEDELRAHFLGLVRQRRMPLEIAEDRLRNALEICRDPERRRATQALMSRDMTEEFYRLGIYCMSEEFDHILMWSHYADHHRGIVVRFQVDPPDFESFVASALPVDYQKDRPTIRMLLDDYRTRFRKALLTKADYWRYEREWRLALPGVPPGPFRIQAGTIDGLFLGARCSDEHQQIVLGWARDASRPIEVFKCFRDEAHFRLGITAVAL